ncbi:hypothetical protein [Roseibium sp. RKSG952]|uniref:hypothetical protein n=1 Tax=Roseibium sp. RKSG952 TaxID=2529384 RepID=UPI0012BC4637|nr:hypothetical protein [Roseibium sp. RKSG952]
MRRNRQAVFQTHGAAAKAHCGHAKYSGMHFTNSLVKNPEELSKSLVVVLGMDAI